MKRRIIALLLCLNLLCSGAGAVLTVEDARYLVEKLYIDDVPEEVLMRESVEEIFAGLDENSNYLLPEQHENFMGSLNDVSTVGIGIVSKFSEDGSCLEIIKVYEDGAAYAAGVRAGDRILAVDGRLVSEAANLEEAGSWMRGEEGTRVSLSLLAPTGGRWATTLTRRPFVIPQTEYELVDGYIGYISCATFGEETYGHLERMMERIGKDTTNWILDLRDNSGGLTQTAADVAGIFGGDGTQTLLRNRAGEYFGYSAAGKVDTMYPVIVLVNEQSASSSELVAAALRDKRAGLIIGSRTFGKGTAQTLVNQTIEPEMFADGDAVRITSYRFFSPAGLTNDKIGILPHLIIEDAYVEAVAYLLCHQTDLSTAPHELQLTLGSWEWHLNLDRALEEEFRPAFEALLEALWPQTNMILSTPDGTHMRVTVADLAEKYQLTGYAPRVFSDAGDSEYGFALNVLGAYDILRGDGTGEVNPKEELTRAQLCAMLAQLLNVSYIGPSLFEDVKEDTWYFSPVNAMAQMGFVEGDGTGAFRPDDVLTNEQMITILARLASWLDVNFYESAKTSIPAEVLEGEVLKGYSPWAREEVWLLGMSRWDYFGNGISYVWDNVASIVPGETALRETTAQSIYRMLNLMGILVP